MTTIQQVVDYNKNHVDWERFFSANKTMGKTMNSKKDRFDASDIREKALECYSNGKIKHIDTPGVDHNLVNLPNSKNAPTTQEMKYEQKFFYEEYSVEKACKRKGFPGVKGVRPRNKPITTKLVNSRGQNSHTTALPESYAEYLLVVDRYSVHVIEVAALTPYLKFGGDGIEAVNVPHTLFHEIVGPDDIKNSQAKPGVNYKEQKNLLQKNFLDQF